jgi:hypothetical protein
MPMEALTWKIPIRWGFPCAFTGSSPRQTDTLFRKRTLHGGRLVRAERIDILVGPRQRVSIVTFTTQMTRPEGLRVSLFGLGGLQMGQLPVQSFRSINEAGCLAHEGLEYLGAAHLNLAID